MIDVDRCRSPGVDDVGRSTNGSIAARPIGASLGLFFQPSSAVSAPDEQLVALANHRHQHPQSPIKGLHFFPFGGLKRTSEWLAKLADGQFEFTSDGGLNVAS